jgi:Zinc knuckle
MALIYYEEYLAKTKQYSTSSASLAHNRNRFFASSSKEERCWSCGSEEHSSYSCQFKRCYKCSDTGHESRECTSREFCSDCRNPGHSNPRECYILQYDVGLELERQAKCVNCGVFGHLSCLQKQKSSPKPEVINLEDSKDTKKRSRSQEKPNKKRKIHYSR